MTDMTEFTVLRGGRVLDAGAHRAEPADILIEGNRIREIGAPGLAAPTGARTIDAADRLLIPGLVNAHTHGHGTFAKGMGDRWTLELLLNAGPWLGGNRSLEHKYQSTLIGALEMVRKGCTACYDLYFEFPRPTAEGLAAVGQAYSDAGMRAVIAPMIADRSFFQALPGLLEAVPAERRAGVEKLSLAPYQETVDACRAIFRDWPFDRDRIRPAIAPTIPLHCSDAFLVACRELAGEFDIGLHTHLAESKAQSVAGLDKYGKTLTAHLADLDLIGPGFTGAHAVWLDDDDIARLADRGAALAHNPGSNMRLGSGLAAARRWADAGLTVGIGTDGASCSDNQNMFEAMRLASFVSRVRSHDPADWLATEQVFEMATAGGAGLLGFGTAIGRLAPGAKADIVALDLANLNFVPFNDPTNQLVHSEDGSAVAEVMVDGRTVYRDGVFSAVDVAGLRRDVEASIADLGELNRDLGGFVAALEPVVAAFCIGLSRRPYHVHGLAGPDY